MSTLPENLDTVVGLSALEPIAGAIFAVSLAYIALPSFRYREEIRQAAKMALHRLDDLNPSEDKCKTHYARLVKFSNGLANKSQKSRLEKNEQYIPDTEDNGPFKSFFLSENKKWPTDKFLVSCIALFSFAMLSIGVTENFQVFGLGLWDGFKNASFVTTIYVFLNISLIIPLIFIYLGNNCVDWARKQIENLEKLCREDFLADSITGQINSITPDFTQMSADHIGELAIKLMPMFQKAISESSETSKAASSRASATRKPRAKRNT